MVRFGFLGRLGGPISLVSAAGGISAPHINLRVQQYLLTYCFLTLFPIARDM